MTPAALPPGPAPATAQGELRATLALAAPLVAANLLQMAVYAIDVIFVARLGTAELAAATLGVYVYSVLMFAMIGLVGAAAPIVAAELGRRAHAVREVRRTFRMALWLAIGAALACMILLSQGERLLLVAHQDHHVAVRAGAFLDILLWALPPAIASGVMRVTAAALGRPGWPTAITALGLGTGFLGNWLLVFGHGGFPALGLIGVTEVAAHAIAFQVPYGIAQAATIRVGMAYGACDAQWIARAGWTALIVGTGFMSVTALVILLMPGMLIGVYVDAALPANAALVGLTLRYLAVAAAFQLFDGAQVVAAGALRGLQDTRQPMLIAAFGYWPVGFGIALALGFGLGWQGLGIWIGLAAGLAAVAVLLVWRWSARVRLGLVPARPI